MDEHRFLDKVEKKDGCWVWTGARKKTKAGGKSYGFFYLDRKVMSAHRASWLLFRGKIPKGDCVLHECDNPSCVRPSHLFLGTHADNAKDRVAKRRSAVGERHGLTTLTDVEVRAIRKSKASQRTLARRYNTSQAAVGRIRRGETRVDA